MKAIWILAVREWRSLFLSPLAWSLLAVLFCICAYMFNSGVAHYQINQMQFQAYGRGGTGPSLTDWTVTPLLGNAAILLLLILPLITMRLIADEKRRRTWPALAASPISPTGIVLGKYLGLLLFLVVTVALLGLMPATLFLYGNPDPGQVLAGLLGLFLVAATFGAVGLAASSATENPIVAAVATFGILLLLWIVAWMGESSGTGMDRILAYASLINHYEKFLHGIVSTADLAYFILVSAGGLIFARQRLLAERLEGH
ncbi:MAG: ABC transporter permease [Magnetococcales bacterium]|nr:ABC transporter permease [Magnetococcales bacterium]